MFARSLLPITLLLGIGLSGFLHAEDDFPEYIVPPKALILVPQHPYTVLSMAPDGSWGVETSRLIGAAITGAITHCKAVSANKLGCGSMSKAIQSGWMLGVSCGGTNILTAAKLLANAELAAINRETELRKVFRNEMPPCVRVVTVDPDGFVLGSASPMN